VFENRDTAQLSCRWPFDISTDEFVEFSNTFAADQVRTMLDDLRKIGHGRAEAIHHGFVCVRRDGDELIFEASNAGTGELSRVLYLRLPPESLYAGRG